MIQMNSLLATDAYKTGHIYQYPKGTNKVYSNYTARSGRHARVPKDWDGKVVFFGFQAFIIEFLINDFQDSFFNLTKDEAVRTYMRVINSALGQGSVKSDHVEALWELGYLPLHIKALPEGSRVPLRIPLITVQNTLDDFFWVTNYIESVLSCDFHKVLTTATTAYEFRRVLDRFVELTGSDKQFANWQLHDFSFRGMSGRFDSMACGGAHLMSSYGTDTIPSIPWLEEYYGANCDTELVGGSVPATEHSVMCMGSQEGELETFRRLITEVYPTGIVSIVSDSWDFWKVLTEYAVILKPEIMARGVNALGQAKVVFRPDSGDPVKIICGDKNAELGSPEWKGAVQVLWEIFGGTRNAKNYKTLDSHVGLIYGDSIDIEKEAAILTLLELAGFAADNIVFGIGSFTYQFVSRDNFGQAMKATYGEIDGVPQVIQKNPKTDDGTKKSARGLLRVEFENGEFVLYEDQTKEQEARGELRTVFLDGNLHSFQTMAGIRQRLGAIK